MRAPSRPVEPATNTCGTQGRCQMAEGAVSTAYAMQCLLAELLARPGSQGALKVYKKRLQVALYTRQCNTSGTC